MKSSDFSEFQHAEGRGPATYNGMKKMDAYNGYIEHEDYFYKQLETLEQLPMCLVRPYFPVWRSVSSTDGQGSAAKRSSVGSECTIGVITCTLGESLSSI